MIDMIVEERVLNYLKVTNVLMYSLLIHGRSVTNLGLGSRGVCYSLELKVLIESSLDVFPNTDSVSHSLLTGDTSLCPLG